MLATVGQEAPFDPGLQQMKLLANLEVTTKAVERTAEAMGEDLAARRPRSNGPCSWTCRSWWESRFPFCTCRWTGPECRS